jgi:flagellar motor protein MotB
MNQQNPRLWELSDSIRELEESIAAILEDDSLSEETHETKLQQAFSQWLATGESFKIKAEQVAAYIRHQEALAEARKAEAKRIRALAEIAENQANRLRNYLTSQMLRAGTDKIDGATVKISLRKKPPQVVLNISPEELPTECVKVTYEPKLTKIKELLKQGSIDWAYLSESQEHSITIR